MYDIKKFKYMLTFVIEIISVIIIYIAEKFVNKDCITST